MSRKAFDFNECELERVYNQIMDAADQSYPALHSYRFRLSFEFFKELIWVTFWSSLETEEGRQVKYSVALCERLYVPDAYPFTKSQPFTIERCTKLAPAMTGDQNLLLTCPAADETEVLEIWGYVPFRPESGINRLIIVQIVDRGRILVHYAGTVVQISRNGLGIVTEGLREGSAIIKKIFPNVLEQLGFYRLFGPIIRSVRSHGNGGTLLLTSHSNDYKDGIKSLIGFDSKNPLTQAIGRYSEVKSAIQSDISPTPSGQNKLLEVELEHELSLIGQLTAVDGAVLTTSNMGELAFGAVIDHNSRMSEHERIRIFDPTLNRWLTDSSLAKIGGTRNQSAAEYVFEHQERFAIVVSHDGPVKLFYWDQDERSVSYLKDADLLFQYFTWA